MIATDKDALICDMAETYKVFDLRALPVPMLATLAAGLRDDSRIKIKLSGARAATDTLLLASIADALNFLAWAKTKAAQTGKIRPKSFLNAFTEVPQTHDEVTGYRTPEDFKAAWQRLGGEANGN